MTGSGEHHAGEAVSMHRSEELLCYPQTPFPYSHANQEAQLRANKTLESALYKKA